MDIETLDDLEAVLKETGYSNRAIAAIIRWYSNETPVN